MPIFLSAFLAAINEGLIFSLLALGVFVAFQWVRFPDLTPDGVYVFSAAVFATCMVHGLPLAVSLLCASLVGGLCGFTTGVINKMFRVPSVVAGLLVATALYSGSWLVLGKPNQYLPITLLFGGGATNQSTRYISLQMGLATAVLATLALGLMSRTIYGIRLRGAGENALLARDFAATGTFYTCSGLFIANSLVGLSGALFCIRSYAADVNSGAGMTITGLAAVVVGRLLAPKAHRPEVLAVSVVGGAVTYKLLIWGALSMGVPPESFRILSSVLLIAVFVFARRADLGLLKGMKWS